MRVDRVVKLESGWVSLLQVAKHGGDVLLGQVQLLHSVLHGERHLAVLALSLLPLLAHVEDALEELPHGVAVHAVRVDVAF